MDVWVVLLEMVKILVPALIIFAVTYTLLNNFFKNEYNKRLLELKTKNQDILTPVRLQAYEPCVLILDRFSCTTCGWIVLNDLKLKMRTGLIRISICAI